MAKTRRTKDNISLIRVNKDDKRRLDEKSRLNNKSMPKVINRLLDEERKIGDRNRMYLEEISQKTGKSMNDVLNQVIAEHEENCIFEGLAADYTKLRQDEVAWREHLEESGSAQINTDEDNNT